MAQLRNPGRLPRDNFKDIPYRQLSPLFLGGQEQRLVPFLGAGASRAAPPPPTADAAAVADQLRQQAPAKVDSAQLQELCDKLHVTSEDGRMFLEIALAILARLETEGQTVAQAASAYESIRESPSAPSAAELAVALAERSEYDFFRSAKERVRKLTARDDWDDRKLTRLMAGLARLTAIGSPFPSLLDASSYSVYRAEREAFWKDLHAVFSTKQHPTDTHDLVAEAAANYIANNRGDIASDDFLIVTTNYDRLMECAMDARSVPYCVLTVPTREPPRVELTFSPNAQSYLELSDARFDKFKNNVWKENNEPKPTTMFSGLVNRPRPMVMLYKIHGSLHPAATVENDSVIITHEDYVNFLSVAGMVPSYITTRLPRIGLLFLGYSFSDWNVRSLYRTVTRYRAAQQAALKDYAVMLDPSPYEIEFFDKNRIDVLDTDLQEFCKRMRHPD